MTFRTERIGDALLILADCREWLASVPECFRVDALITDPPYGIGFTYESHDDTPEGYGPRLWAILEACERHLTEGSPVFVFQAMLNCRRFATWFPREWRIYSAAKNFVQMRPTVMQYAVDPVVCWWTPGKPWAAGTLSRDFFIADTAAQISDRSNLEKGHPCPRPLDQMRTLVEQWVRPDGAVLDPFMGSGTTGVACAQLGRKFIGIEIEPKYFEIACERITNAYRQAKLFPDVPPRDAYEQTTLDYQQ